MNDIVHSQEYSTYIEFMDKENVDIMTNKVDFDKMKAFLFANREMLDDSDFCKDAKTYDKAFWNNDLEIKKYFLKDCQLEIKLNALISKYPEYSDYSVDQHLELRNKYFESRTSNVEHHINNHKISGS